MKTFRNTSFTKRNYECTNIVMCQTDGDPKVQGDRQSIAWEETTQQIPAGMVSLYVCNGVRYFGYL